MRTFESLPKESVASSGSLDLADAVNDFSYYEWRPEESLLNIHTQIYIYIYMIELFVCNLYHFCNVSSFDDTESALLISFANVRQ